MVLSLTISIKQVYHQYVSIIRDTKAQIHTINIDDQEDYDPLEYDIKFGQSDTYTGLLLQDLKHVLTDQEYYVIYEHFFQQRSIQEIADKVGTNATGYQPMQEYRVEKAAPPLGKSLKLLVTHLSHHSFKA